MILRPGRTASKTNKLAVTFAIVVISAILLKGYVSAAFSPTEFSVGGHSYRITYVAQTTQKWQQGLMNKTITNSTIELFLFPSMSNAPFWMKDVTSPLDVIYLNGSRVVSIMHLPPCSSYDPSQENCTMYFPGVMYDKVIEAHLGFAQTANISYGTNISIK